jgi:hypothetical protein
MQDPVEFDHDVGEHVGHRRIDSGRRQMQRGYMCRILLEIRSRESGSARGTSLPHRFLLRSGSDISTNLNEEEDDLTFAFGTA